MLPLHDTCQGRYNCVRQVIEKGQIRSSAVVGIIRNSFPFSFCHYLAIRKFVSTSHSKFFFKWGGIVTVEFTMLKFSYIGI